MKKVMRRLGILFVMIILAGILSGCDGAIEDLKKTIEVGNKLQTDQATPTDLEYSLERYNLIRRAYWVNGQREKARTLACPITKPLGYVTLFTGNAAVGSFEVDGKVTSLNSYLTPDTMSYDSNRWIPDVDGSYGENDSGIFFFTPDGKYIEWSGEYLYSDIPFHVENPVVKYEPEKGSN